MTLEITNETDMILDQNLESRIQDAMSCVLRHESITVDGEVSLLFVDNDKIQLLNKEYRGKDLITDVLSFPQYESIKNDGINDFFVYLGDIVISLDQANLQAAEFGHSIEREIVYLVVHSLLHLLGYDHMIDKDKTEMRAHEKVVLKELGIFK
ncbi:MAG: rRNA maturation RNase YbeY [Clostridia bacterium]|nr:rRNA maturation RNase YbeY [Clostridia bacterium]